MKNEIDISASWVRIPFDDLIKIARIAAYHSRTAVENCLNEIQYRDSSRLSTCQLDAFKQSVIDYCDAEKVHQALLVAPSRPKFEVVNFVGSKE